MQQYLKGVLFTHYPISVIYSASVIPAASPYCDRKTCRFQLKGKISFKNSVGSAVCSDFIAVCSYLLALRSNIAPANIV